MEQNQNKTLKVENTTDQKTLKSENEVNDLLQSLENLKIEDQKKLEEQKQEHKADLDQEMKDEIKIVDFKILEQTQKYDAQNLQRLQDLFKNVDPKTLQRITLSGNSYSEEACQWLAENILKKSDNLQFADFSNMFIGRKKDEIPQSLKLLLDAIELKSIKELNLQDNAIGEVALSSFTQFLEKCSSLEVLNIANCGLNHQSCKVIAESILKNKDMKLKEFYAFRQRLEEGVSELSKVFEEQKSLVKIDLSSNHCKRGLGQLLNGLVACKDTLQYVNIHNNRSINKSVNQLQNLIKNCLQLQYLNISDLNLKKKYTQNITDALNDSFQSGSQLRELIWNYDPSRLIADEFLSGLINLKDKIQIRKIQMFGVFLKQENRSKMRNQFEKSNIRIELFKPEFTDDESCDHDDSEEPDEDELTSHSSQEEQQ